MALSARNYLPLRSRKEHRPLRLRYSLWNFLWPNVLEVHDKRFRARVNRIGKTVTSNVMAPFWSGGGFLIRSANCTPLEHERLWPERTQVV